MSTGRRAEHVSARICITTTSERLVRMCYTSGAAGLARQLGLHLAMWGTLMTFVSGRTRTFPRSTVDGARWRVLAVFSSFLAAAAFAIPSVAWASPGLVGARHLGMGNASRASARGTGAMLVNPANLGFTRQFEIEPVYQGLFESNTHGTGILAMDSLLNERIALGLGYITTIGAPKIRFETLPNNQVRNLTMAHGGHEASLPISFNAVLGWLAFGVRPKFQYTALRFLDDDERRRDARKTLTAFGLDLSASLSIMRLVHLSVVGYNISGPAPPATTLELSPFDVDLATLDRARMTPVSDYPRSLATALAVFPNRDPGISLNFDGLYDFTSYRHDAKFTRMVFSGGAEYTVRGMVPLRLGGYWDSRGRGSADDRGYIAMGLGFFRPAPKGSVGFNVSLGFSRQVTGPNPETLLAFGLGFLLNPNR